MILNNNKIKKDPSQEKIKFILELLNSNKLKNAKREARELIVKYPNSSVLFNILGAVLVGQNEFNKGIENYKKAIQINPNYAQAYNNLGVALHKLNKKNEAINNFKKAISLKTDFAEAYNNLGNATQDINKPLEAQRYLEKALQFKSNYAEAYNNLGRVYENLGKKTEALKHFQKAININPDYAEAYNNIGLALFDMTRFDESILSYKKAINLKPNYEKSYNNLGNVLSCFGKYDEAENLYRQAIKIKPDNASAYSNLLLNYNYKAEWDSNSYLLKAKKYRLNCKSIKKKLPFQYQYEKNPKKIKLGFVSADFGNHPGGYFTLSTLRELKNKNFDLIAYVTNERNDAISHHFKPLFLKWNLISRKNDEEVVEQIIKDGVHILIDAQGHSSENRLSIFMYKPAPIQATWLGQGSTGIPEIDYFIGSPHITPEKEKHHYVEKILRLPEISQCFTSPDFYVGINNLPALKNNFITFGCINKLTKMNNDVVALWSKILFSSANSKLILKSWELDNQNVASETLERFKKYKINKNRLILLGRSKTRKEVLEVYNKIDIALDPFPFQGNTSTFEAVWMGVPVITLKGSRYLFHFGEMINSNLNMEDWIAENNNEYISKAIKFSSNIDLLSKIRTSLREKALQSPLFDAPRFAKHFDKMLWEMWMKFCL